MTRWVLTAGLLVLILLARVAPVGAQTQGPGPGEVPHELWQKYPLKPSPAEPREETGQQRPRRRSEARASDPDTGGGNQNTSFIMGAGLLALVLSVILMTAARRGRVPKKGGSATTAGRSQRTARGELPAAALMAPAARKHECPAPPRPRPAPAPMQPYMAADRDVHAQATLSRQPALGYASAPAEGDADGLMSRQQREIEAVCKRKGLGLLRLVRDIEAREGSDLSRPGLAYTLEGLATREASCLVVSSLERLTRSESTLGTLFEWLDRCGARLVVVDTDLDTGTPTGRLRAKARAVITSSEREPLGRRTGDRHDAARPARSVSGQPAVRDEAALKQRIADMRESGMTLQAIANTLNAEGVPTLRGGIRWRPSSVQAAAGYKRPTQKSRRRSS